MSYRYLTQEHRVFRDVLRKFLEKDRDIAVTSIYAGTNEIMKQISVKKIWDYKGDLRCAK